MGLTELKSSLYKIIENEKDATLLEAVYEILNNNENPSERLSSEEYEAIIKAGRKQIKDGGFKKNEEVKKLFM